MLSRVLSSPSGKRLPTVVPVLLSSTETGHVEKRTVPPGCENRNLPPVAEDSSIMLEPIALFSRSLDT
jgi:hypothetical protein